MTILAEENFYTAVHYVLVCADLTRQRMGIKSFKYFLKKYWFIHITQEPTSFKKEEEFIRDNLNRVLKSYKVVCMENGKVHKRVVKLAIKTQCKAIGRIITNG